MSQFNAFQPEQNSKRDLVEAWEIANEENQRLQKRLSEIEKSMNEIVEAVLDNRSKMVTIKTLSIIKEAIYKFNLIRDKKNNGEPK